MISFFDEIADTFVTQKCTVKINNIKETKSKKANNNLYTTHGA